MDLNSFLLLLFIGFFAEIVDGTLGMAYGVTSNSFLLSVGYAPAFASAIVHTAEIFTTLTSGVSHLKLGNVDKKLAVDLIIPGTLSAIVGAYFIVNINIPIKPIISLYLIGMGGIILLRAFGKNLILKKINSKLLALIGGFVDAVGGGGWGPVVTSTLVANGYNPRKTVGTVNFSEFFITVCQATAFFIMLGIVSPYTVIAFILGGVIAAPIGAYACKKVNTKTLMATIGVLIILLNLNTLSQFL